MLILNLDAINAFSKKYSESVGDPVDDLISEKSKGKRLQDFLKRFSHHDEFYTVFNLKEQKLTWEHGMERYLGYNITEDEKTIDFFFSLIHPFISQWVTAYVYGITSCLLEKKISQLEYLKTRYCTNLPLRKANGTFMLVKQISMPFQFDKNGLVVSYINSSSIVDVYKGEPIKPRLFHTGEKFDNRLKSDELEIIKAALPFLNIPKDIELKSPLWRATEAVLSLSPRFASMPGKMLHSELKRDDGGKYKPTAINKNFSRIREVVTPLLNLPPLNSTNPADIELSKYLPDFNNVHTLLNFMKDSKIIEVLRQLQAQKV